MKSFGLWLAVALAAFGGLALAYHLALTAAPNRVLVVIDSSFAMRDDWPGVARALKRFETRRYSEFALITEKRRIHGWRATLRPGRLSPYAPRDFAKLADGTAFPEIAEAAEIHFLTNAPTAETEAFTDWRLTRP